MKNNIIKFEKVSFSYNSASKKRVDIYNEYSFEINAGTLTTIIGSSGTGKTTLLNLIAGFLKPQNGTITVNGTVVSSMTEDEACDFRNKTIGFIYQSFNLLPEISVQQNVMLPLIIAHKSDAKRKAAETLCSLGLEHRLDYPPTKLSGGEQQRTAIARAIANDADIILADEPTGNLDKENSDSVKRILKDLAIYGKTVVIVSHDLSFVEISDRVIDISEIKE